MQCIKCSQEMEKKGVLESGNIKLQQWRCRACLREQSQALGLVGGMPEWG